MSIINQHCFFVACVEADHNATCFFIETIAPERCTCDLQLSSIPRNYSAFPRFCYDLRPHSNRGRWVSVMIQGETIIRFFVESFNELADGLKNICTICSVHTTYCRHRGERQDHVKWTVYANNRAVKNTAQLAQATCRDHHMLLAEFEFALEPELQCLKTYDDFRPQLQNKKTYSDILSNPGEFEPYFKLLEDCFTLVMDFKRSKSKTHLLLSCSTFIRSVTGRSSVFLMKDVVEKLIEPLGSAFVRQDRKSVV